MNPEILLSKCISLLYRESQLENSTETSADLVRTAVEKLKINDALIGIPTKRDATLALKALVLEMSRHGPGHEYDLTELLQQIRLITNGDDNLYNAIAQGIEQDMAQPILKRNITNLRKTVSNYFREQRIAEIVSKAHRDLNFGRHNITDLSQYIRNIITELEVTSAKAVAKDPAIVYSMEIGDDKAMQEIFGDVASSNTEGLAFNTGYQELNEALQGGPRPGDAMIIGALQHNYKSGMSLALFANIAIFNKPKTKDPSKKPLLYRVSCEDPLRNNAQFLYQLLKYDETRVPVNVKKVSTEEMYSYVKQRLQVNGFHILLEEVNPSQWTYQSLINRVVELESQGYSVEVLSIDYLSKLPTTGCVQGSLGDDVMDMLSRVRAFALANGILFISPHQLSTDAKRKLETVPAEQFLHTIKGGGFFEKTKGLDRIYDIGLLIHKVETNNNGDWLHCVVDKHRFPSVVDSKLKSWYMKFPDCKMPIPSNIHDEGYQIHRKIPRGDGGASNTDSFFNFPAAA